MATAHSRGKITAGSAEWVGDERISTLDFVKQETEEFAFSVRNEMDWLNEHMAEVFNRSQFDVVEAFKTPGKLRAKTPRTTRRPNAFESRAPLTNLFFSNTQPTPNPIQGVKFTKQSSHFQVAEDQDNHHVNTQPMLRFSAGPGKENTDSGYHEMTDDDNGDDNDFHDVTRNTVMEELKSPAELPRAVEWQAPLAASHKRSKELRPTEVDDNEDHDTNVSSPASIHEMANTEPIEMELDNLPQRAIISSGQTARTSHQFSLSADTVAAFDNAMDEVERTSPQRVEMHSQPDSSPSSISSLARPLLRKKSSLTFASLPAREPLTTKKSLGPRVSRISHIEQPRLIVGISDNYLGKFAGSRAQTETSREPVASDLDYNDDEDHGEMAAGRNTTIQAEKAQQEMKAQSKASTQRLQERLAMLGKSNPPRLSRSVPTTITISQTTVRESASAARDSLTHKIPSVDDTEDWIGPMPEAHHPAPAMPTAIETHKAIARAEANDGRLEEISRGTAAKPHGGVLEIKYPTVATPLTVSEQSPVRPILGPSYPNLSTQVSTTPINSPVQRRNMDGPLSASKAKLYSVLKSAKGMFASTAHVTTQSRPETKLRETSPSKVPVFHTQPKNTTGGNENKNHISKASDEEVSSVALVRDNMHHEQTQSTRRSSQRLEVKKLVEAKRTQEKEKLNQEVSKLINEQRPEVLPEKTTGPAVSSLEDFLKNQNSSRNNDAAPVGLPLSTVPPKTQLPIPQLQKPGEARRPLRPAKDAPKARPAPVSIKLASQRIGQIASSNASLGLALHESLAQPSLSRPTMSKKASTSSFHTTSSSQSFKTSVTSNSTRPRALEAAARKKEQDEKEANRKLEQRRELERKRAAKVEEERRSAEEQKVAEQQRQAEARNAAQRQAAEQRKADAVKRNEQLRKEAAVVRNRATEDNMDVIQVDKSHMQSDHRNDDNGSNIRVPRNATAHGPDPGAVPHINPAKPAKRPLEVDEQYADDDIEQQQRHPATDAAAPKRRRTSEGFVIEAPSRPTMAPPIRPSNMHKKLSNKFTQGFLNNTVTTHAAPSMLKTAVTTQHNLQHPKTPHMNDLAKFSNAKITFAEQSHPVHPGSQAQLSQQHQRIQPTTKTPGTAFKSSPQYPNGDAIDLPEIATDSEDSGDDNDFVPPDWANSPELRELLRRQQLVDPLQVFGPIAPLMMEEVFKGNKERQARFRARTSSANWNGPDRLTEEERRRDREAREKLETEGAWTYGGSV